MLVIHVFHNDQWNGLHTASLFRRRVIVFGRHCCVSVRSSTSTQSCFVERIWDFCAPTSGVGAKRWSCSSRQARSANILNIPWPRTPDSVAPSKWVSTIEPTIVDVCANADEALRCVVDCCFESVWTRPAMHWYSFLEFLYEHHRPRDFNFAVKRFGYDKDLVGVYLICVYIIRY